METPATYTAGDAESKPVHFTIRHDSVNSRHARVTVFANHASCGQLTFTLDEWAAFCAVFREFAKLERLPVTVEFDSAFELHPPGQEPRATIKLPPFNPPAIRFFPDPDGDYDQ